MSSQLSQRLEKAARFDREQTARADVNAVDQNTANRLENSASGSNTVTKSLNMRLEQAAIEGTPGEQRKQIITNYVENPTPENIDEVSVLEPIDQFSDVPEAEEKQIAEVKRVRGFRANLPQTIGDLQDVAASGGLGAFSKILSKKITNVFREEDEIKKGERIEEVGRLQNIRASYANVNTPILDERDLLEASGENPERLAQLDAQLSFNAERERKEIAGELDEEAEVEFTRETIGLILDAIKEDPGAAGAEVINALIADPELLLVPTGFVGASSGITARTANTLGAVGSRVAGATGGTATAAALGGTLEAGIELAKQIEETGQVNTDQVIQAGKVGAVVSAVLTPAAVYGITAARSTTKKIRELGQQNVDKRVREVATPDKDVSDINDEVFEGNVAVLRTRAKKQQGDFGKVSQVGAASAAQSRLGLVLGGAVDAFNDSAASFGKKLDIVLGPVSTRLQNISPKIATRFNKLHQNTSLRINEGRAQVGDFATRFRSLDEGVRQGIDIDLKNGRIDAAAAKMREVGGEDFVKAFRDTQALVNKLRQELIDAGGDVKLRENFFPRAVRDFPGLLDSMGEVPASNYQRLVRKRQDDLGRELTDDELSELLVRSVSDKNNPLSIPSSARARTIDAVTPENNVFYDDSVGALLRYIDEFSDSIETRSFFNDLGGSGRTPNESIDRLLDSNTLTPRQNMDLENVLKARFVDAKKPISPFLQKIRSFTTLATLGNFTNAITQFGDLFLAGFRNGFIRTGIDAFRPKKITPEDIGVFRIEQEFIETNKINGTIDRIFSLTGFRAIDRVGKSTLINSAFNKAVSRVKKPKSETEFRAEHVETYGDELDDLVDAFKRGDATDENVKLFLWNELSKNQPISLAEMPEFYLRNPNGRILYALKTFTIKLLDMSRREVFREIARGNVRTGVQNGVRLSTAMWLGGMTADSAKDFILGRDTEFDDNVIDNLYGIIGLNNYTMNQVANGDIDLALMSQMFGSALASVAVGDDIFTDTGKLLTDEEFELLEANSFRRLPVIGNVFESIQRRANDEE